MAEGIGVIDRPVAEAVEGPQKIEQSVKLENSASRPDLQAALLCARQNFVPDVALIADRLQVQTSADRWEWYTFKSVSDQDRRNLLHSGKAIAAPDAWAKEFQKWAAQTSKTDATEIKKILGGIGVQDMDDETSIQNLLSVYANDPEGMQKFMMAMLSIYGDQKALSPQAQAAMYGVAHGLFGKVGADVTIQILYLEQELKQTSAGAGQLANKLSEEGSHFSPQTSELIGKMRDLLMQSRMHVNKVDKQEDARPASEQSASFEASETDQIAIASEQGGRSEQQDSVTVVKENLPPGVKSLVILADGHGENGARVSRVAGEAFQKSLVEILQSQPQLSMQEALKQAIELTETQAASIDENSGTTFIAAVQAVDGSVFLAHVGDSRAYSIGNSTAEQLTADHNWPGGERRYGLMVSRALGDSSAKDASSGEFSAKPDIIGPLTTVNGNVLILTTDGIILTKEELAVLVKDKLPKDATDAIMEANRQKIAGFTEADNYSVAVLRLS